MEDLTSLVSEYLYSIKGSIQIYNCWNNNEFICEIFILSDNTYLIETFNEFPYSSYHSFLTKLPKKVIIKEDVFDFFLTKYHGFTAEFYIIDKNNVKYLYPSSFMNDDQVIWISEVIDEIKSFIYFVRNLTIIC